MHKTSGVLVQYTGVASHIQKMKWEDLGYLFLVWVCVGDTLFPNCFQFSDSYQTGQLISVHVLCVARQVLPSELILVPDSQHFQYAV